MKEVKPMWPDRCTVCNVVIHKFKNDSTLKELCVWCRDMEIKLESIGKRIMRIDK
jgi:hypothetical protein